MCLQHLDIHCSPHFCAAISQPASQSGSFATLQVPAVQVLCRCVSMAAQASSWAAGHRHRLGANTLSLSAEPAAHQAGTMAAGHSAQAEHPCGLPCVPPGHDSFPDAHSRQPALLGAEAPRWGGQGHAWRGRQHAGKQVCRPAVL